MRRHAPLDDPGRPFAALHVELEKVKARDRMIDEYAAHELKLDLAIETAIHVYGYRTAVGILEGATDIMALLLRRPDGPQRVKAKE